MHKSLIYLNNFYKNFQVIVAVDNVSFMIEKEEIFGFQDKDAVRSCKGVVCQDAVLGSKLAGRKILDLHARLHGMDRDMRRKRIDEVPDIVDMRKSEAFDDPMNKWLLWRKRS